MNRSDANEQPGAISSELKVLVTEATRALARLDIARLEELALSCQALMRMPVPATEREREGLVSQVRGVRREMETFARVLEATRANAKVMERLRLMRSGTRGYEELGEAGRNFSPCDSEGRHGNN